MANNIILNNSINNVKLGDNQIFKIFKGIDLVWSTSIPLAPSLYTGLIANYKLDETSGTTAIDETGNHNGIINGTPTLGVAANLGTAIAFNMDASNFIDLGTRNLIGGKGAFTLASWCKLKTGISWDGNLYGAWSGTKICSFSNNGSSYERWINYFYVSGAQKGGAFNFTTEQWSGQYNYKLMISTYDGAVFRCFLNDKESSNSYAVTGNVQVGSGENESIGRGFTSQSNRIVSSLQIWDRALNTDERTSLFNGGMGQIL